MNIIPIRIQRKRTKGWTMPENTVSVTRPGPYGNPFKIGHHYKKYDPGAGIPRMGMRFIYTEAFEGYQDKTYTTIKTVEESIEWYKWYLSTYGEDFIKKIKEKLAGKNLMCWCRVGDPCHADLLLELVNS